MITEQRVAVISHASLRKVNRSPYRYLKTYVKSLQVIIPASIRTRSGQEILAEAAGADDPALISLELVGMNPRTYYYPALMNWLNTNKPTVILLENDPVSKLGFQIAAWCRKNDAAVICQTYDNIPRGIGKTVRNQGWKKVPTNLVIKALNVWMSRRVGGILVVNEDSASLFKDYGYPRVTRIPLGYDPAVFYSDERLALEYRSRLGVADHTVIVAYFGRVIREKGVDLLVRALAALKDLDWIMLLDHIHDNESGYTASVKKLIAEEGLSERVKYFDADHIEIGNYMRASDLMAAPSITTRTFKEQYGRTVQEAMACGCVSLVSDSGHLPVLAGFTDVIFREGDLTALTQLLRTYIVNQSERNRLSQAQKKRAEQYLTAEIQAKITVKLINALTRNNVDAE